MLQEVPLSFVPGAITFDGPYQLFYATNAESVAGAVPGSWVMEVTMEGQQRELFVLARELLDQGITATSMHYASHTGTLFVLCSSCSAVVEVWWPSNARTSLMRTLFHGSLAQQVTRCDDMLLRCCDRR